VSSLHRGHANLLCIIPILSDVPKDWRQKSRAMLLREGDKNTRFFFRPVAYSHQRNNCVDSLDINGSMSSNSTEIRKHIAQFYNRLLF
jgi:hypothetical protein